MGNADKIKQYLTEFSIAHPSYVAAQLKKGDQVRKSFGCIYEIDNVDADKQLGNFPEGTIVYGPIYRALKSSQGEILKLFNSRRIVPFSEAVKAGAGQCLEKAVLTQLAAQRGSEGAFLINGALGVEGEPGVEAHAFNVCFRGGKSYLVDVENPLAVSFDGKVTHPYIAPLIDLAEDRLVVSPEWTRGREYFLS